MKKFFPLHNFRSVPAILCFFVTAGIGVTIDLWSKFLAETHLLNPRRVLEVVPGWLQLEYTTNEGAVFGLGQGMRWLFLSVSVAALFFLVHLFATCGRQRFYQFALGLLLGGVIGNMYDRLRFGKVRDMLHALPGWTWPGSDKPLFPYIFNVADTMLCVGVGLIVLYSLIVQPREPRAKRAGDSPTPPPRV